MRKSSGIANRMSSSMCGLDVSGEMVGGWGNASVRAWWRVRSHVERVSLATEIVGLARYVRKYRRRDFTSGIVSTAVSVAYSSVGLKGPGKKALH